MATLVTPEDLNLIISFIEGTNSSVPMDAITRIQLLSLEATKALGSAYSKRGMEINRMQRHLTRIEKKEEAAIATEEAFVDLGLDSLDIANDIIAELHELKCFNLSKDFVQNILFEVYASWLHSKKERISIEHPVATPYGPRFWRAYSKMDFKSGDAAQMAMKNANPGLYVMIRNAARKYCDYNPADLSRLYKKCDPYTCACPKDGEKWNIEITDNSIYNWKRNLNK